MKLFAVSALIATLAAQVSAECSNGCSGHGRCTNYKMTLSTATDSVPSIKLAYPNTYGYDPDTTKKDSCTCFSRDEEGTEVFAWTGADCSLRTCPHGPAWSLSPSGTNSHNTQTECSNAGTCDRKSGMCKCFAGYTGRACQRTTCPNNCSGRGNCVTLNEVASSRRNDAEGVYAGIAGFSFASIQYTSAWDADRIRGCECDPGFAGADCSIQECPSGADPMGGPGASSGRVCSGRGKCNTASGTCECHKGFFGTRCELQRANVV